ncbi:hypothetical protein PDR95_25495 [Bacillus cereus]|nr:hypothetical protein [Bacillus cereus]MDA2710673.1 hypothetical protein [Bacillus cereus]
MNSKTKKIRTRKTEMTITRSKFEVERPVETKPCKFLFWNVLKKDLSNVVCDIAEYYDADFILLAELKKDDTKKYEAELNKKGYKLRTLSSAKVKIFDRLDINPGKSIVIPKDVKVKQKDRITSMLYNINGERILLVGIHLFSKATMKNDSNRQGFARLASETIEYIEEVYEIDKTIIMGDFNVNPYEPAMIEFFGMHATMCRNTALKEERVISDVAKRYLFNPSWQAYSNVGSDDTPPGTYYFDEKYDTTLTFWNVLDQVLIRPKLVKNSLNFEIISGAGDKVPTLLSDGIPDKENYSDHLPILYTIKI